MLRLSFSCGDDFAEVCASGEWSRLVGGTLSDETEEGLSKLADGAEGPARMPNKLERIRFRCG